MTRKDSGRELPTLAEYMTRPGTRARLLPTVAAGATGPDTASAFLAALFSGLRDLETGNGLARMDGYLHEACTGFVRDGRLYLYPRQSLHAAKTNARLGGTRLSASAQRIEDSLREAGWRYPNPGMSATISIVDSGKRRTAWEIPALVYANASAIPAPPTTTPAQTLKALARLFTVRETARLFEVSLSTMEYWIYMGRAVPERTAAAAAAMHTIAHRFIQAGHSNPLFWLRQSSAALQKVHPQSGDIPRELLLTGVTVPVLEAANFAIAAGDSHS